MARKRMIDPSFWTDSVMVSLPFEARLLFIGLWNFADDYGYLDDEPERIALQVLPADDVDVELLLDLLVAAGRLDRYVSPDGSWFLHIPHFAEHQRVDHPSRPTFPELEDCRKASIPTEARQQVALKYGCPPGEAVKATCYYCGAVGSIHWSAGRKGQASYWVSFSRLELDHFVAEQEGGPTLAENLVLACRLCNRSKGTRNGIDFASRPSPSPRERSRARASPPAKLISLEEGSVEEVNPPAPAANARVRAREAAPSAPPARFAGVDALLRDLPAYHPTAAFYGKLDKYATLDLEEEALKMQAWVTARPHRECSVAFVLNWLQKAQAEQTRATAPAAPRRPRRAPAPAAAPASGGWQSSPPEVIDAWLARGQRAPTESGPSQ